MTDIKTFEIQKYNISEKSIVKLTTFNEGKMVEIQDSMNYNRNNNIRNYKRINKNEKINVETGEIIKCNNEKEFKDKQDIRNSMKRVKKLLLNNFNGEKNELFITLTYAEQQKSFDKAKKDVENFCRRLQYNNKDNKEIEYLYVLELQMLRQSWHIHMLTKEKNVEKAQLTEKEINDLWKEGKVDVKEIEKKEDIIYIEDYFIKLKGKDINREEIDDEVKIKAGRRIYGSSKGIKMPKEEQMSYKEAKEKVKNMQYKGSNTYTIETKYEDKTKDVKDKDRYRNVTLNIIQKEYYTKNT